VGAGELHDNLHGGQWGKIKQSPFPLYHFVKCCELCFMPSSGFGSD
jgi:hypothetical protein